MLKNLQEFIKVKSLDEAQNILKNKAGAAAILAGGTSLMKSGDKRINTIVDISSLEEKSLKDIIIKDSYIYIGALCTINKIMRSKEISDIFGDFFYSACLTLAAEPLRNLITFGGNIVQVYQWSHFPVLLCVLNGRAILHSGEKIEFKDFFSKHPKTFLKKDDIVVGAEIDKPENSRRFFFKRTSFTAFDYSIASLAMNIKFNTVGNISDLKISTGALRPLPYIIHDFKGFQDYYMDKALNMDSIQNICLFVEKNIKPNKDFRVSNEYKVKCLAGLIKNCFI